MSGNDHSNTEEITQEKSVEGVASSSTKFDYDDKLVFNYFHSIPKGYLKDILKKFNQPCYGKKELVLHRLFHFYLISMNEFKIKKKIFIW